MASRSPDDTRMFYGWEEEGVGRGQTVRVGRGEGEAGSPLGGRHRAHPPLDGIQADVPWRNQVVGLDGVHAARVVRGACVCVSEGLME